MTSLIFGSIYLAHKGVVGHRNEKQRQKNYQRWEDLRDEYDAQKKITRETRSLDIQRTGSMYGQEDGSSGIFTLRDQQEANDARTSWRPQESWEPAHGNPNANQNQSTPFSAHNQQPSPQPQQPNLNIQRTGSVPSAYWANRGELRPQKTGMTWDEGLPAPLRVARRSYDDYEYPMRNGGTGAAGARSNSVQIDSPLRLSARASPLSTQPTSRESSRPPTTNLPVVVASSSATSPFVPASSSSPLPSFSPVPQSAPPKIPTFNVEPIESHVPGGRMAELIERGY